MKKITLALGMALCLSSAALAHEGHNHDSPTIIQAPKGGVIKSLEATNVEVVSKGKQVAIYLYDKSMKLQNVAGYTVSAQAELPRGKKVDEIKLTPKETFYEGSYDAKGLHRYTLVVAIADPKTGHSDKLKFTIEPKK